MHFHLETSVYPFATKRFVWKQAFTHLRQSVSFRNKRLPICDKAFPFGNKRLPDCDKVFRLETSMCKLATKHFHFKTSVCKPATKHFHFETKVCRLTTKHFLQKIIKAFCINSVKQFCKASAD